MKRLKATNSSGLTYVDKNNTLGVFYNSYDKKRHLAYYIPYIKLPSEFLCKKSYGNFSPSGEDVTCLDCYSALVDILIKSNDE